VGSGEIQGTREAGVPALFPLKWAEGGQWKRPREWEKRSAGGEQDAKDREGKGWKGRHTRERSYRGAKKNLDCWGGSFRFSTTKRQKYYEKRR